MNLIQKIKRLSIGIGSILFVVVMLLLVVYVDSLPFEVFVVLAVMIGVVILSSVVYQAYINLRQFYVSRNKEEMDATCESIQEEQESNEDNHKYFDLKNKIAFFMINGIAQWFDKEAEWNKENNEIVIRDRGYNEERLYD